MKKLYTFLIFAFIVGISSAQIVNIPDANFKTKLLASSPTSDIAFNSIGIRIKIDGNDDGEIQLAEALEVYRLELNIASIGNPTGIGSFTNLRYLNFINNQITSLDVTSLIYLRELECYSNQLTSLNVSGLVDLQILGCEGNQLTSLNASGLTSLYRLSCSQNQLTSLNLSGLTNLSELRCEQNQLTLIDVNDCIHVGVFDCSQNQLTTLNVSALHILYTLFCQDNQLTSLFVKNGADESVYFGLNPNIQYICADESQLANIQNYIDWYGYANCNTGTYCSFTPGGINYTIQGNHKLDVDNNGCDNNDILIPNLRFSINDGATTAAIISNASGNYSIPVSAGTYTITPVFENPNYYTASPVSINADFPTTTSPLVQNFCVAPNGLHQDLETWIIPLTRARPGFDARYKVFYRNKGNNIISGNLSFGFDDEYMDFVSATPMQSNQSFSLLNWDYSNLLPFETRQIEVTFNLNTPLESLPLNAGNYIKFESTAYPLIGDEYQTDNSNRLAQLVVNSLDPNDKTCIEGPTITEDMVGEYVHYVIRFENTGTANAQNIVVKDMIDTTKYDVSSLVPLSGSAAYTTRISNTNQVEFVFQNINLPFTAGTNTGYVAFKIKTKPTLVVGDTFSNSANIYFDYNAPIVTNTATTTIATLGTQDFEFSSMFSLSPVPAKNVLTITTKQDVVMSSVSIYNMLGQLIQVNTNPNEAIDVSGLKTGSYFVKIVSDKGTASSKFIKE